MKKMSKHHKIALITLIILVIGGYLISKQVTYNQSSSLVKETLDSNSFSSVEFLEPTLNEHGDENAYVFNRYTSTDKEDIKKVVEFINQLRYSDEFIEGNDVELGVVRRLKLYGPQKESDYEIVFSKNMDSISFPDEEVPRYTRYPLFKNSNLLDLMDNETQDIYDTTTETESVG